MINSNHGRSLIVERTAGRLASKRLLFQLAISVAACTVLVFLVDWPELLNTLLSMDPFWFLIGFFITHLDRFLMSYKWNLLLKGLGLKISQWVTIRAYYIGTFWGTFLPASIGGDVIRMVWIMRSHQGERARIATTVVLEKLLGIVALAMLATVSMVVASAVVEVPIEIIFTMVLSVVAVALLLTSLFLEWPHLVLQRTAAKYLPQRFSNKIAKLSTTVLKFRGRRGLLSLFVLLTVLENMILVLAIYTLARSLQLDLSLVWAAICVPIILTAIRMPINTFGVQEGIYVLILSFSGLSATASISLALAGRVMEMLVALPGAFLAFSWKEKRLLRSDDMQKMADDL